MNEGAREQGANEGAWEQGMSEGRVRGNAL